MVCGWRKERKDPFLSRKLPSLLANYLIRSDAPTPIHDYGCFLRAYTNAAAKELSYYSTSRGWFPVLFAKLGFRVGEVAVSHHERPGGEQSKHSVFTRLDQFMSVFMGATTKPFASRRCPVTEARAGHSLLASRRPAAKRSCSQTPTFQLRSRSSRSCRPRLTRARAWPSPRVRCASRAWRSRSPSIGS